MKKIYKIFEVVIYTIIFLTALLLVWSVLPVSGGPKFFVVLSGSMEPAIRTGSVVVIKPESEYKIGDVVTFGKDTLTQIPTTHRIVSSRAEEGVLLFTTKGDANNGPDTTEIRQSDIHGKVLFSVPLVGYVIDFVKKPIGIILVIVLPAILIIYDEIKKIINEVKRIKKEKISDGENSEKNNV